MYPNPQDVLPLPPRPDLGQYRTRAKELHAAAQDGDAALLSWARDWIAVLSRLQADSSTTSARELERRAGQVAHFARERLVERAGNLSQAQFVIARAHGFLSWPALVAHVEGLAEPDSATAAYEAAADAIVTGDLPALTRLLRADPSLIRARSRREHEATLLHYVSANGVEHYRQRTPANILDVARHLLDAGAEVDAPANVYGGGATTLALTVTSAHPRAAGVQNALADLLLARGAVLDPRLPHYCLVNGCPEAAAHLASLGAPVDVVTAAGIGRVEVVREALAAPGGLSATDQGRAMVMAAWYGERAVVAAMLEAGVAPGAVRGEDGQTALHVAAFQGDVALVELLLAHEAPVALPDKVYGTPPLVWALHAWLVEQKGPAEAYAQVATRLLDAGAVPRREWLDDPRVRAQPALHARMAQAVARS